MQLNTTVSWPPAERGSTALSAINQKREPRIPDGGGSITEQNLVRYRDSSRHGTMLTLLSDSKGVMEGQKQSSVNCARVDQIPPRCVADPLLNSLQKGLDPPDIRGASSWVVNRRKDKGGNNRIFLTGRTADLQLSKILVQFWEWEIL